MWTSHETTLAGRRCSQGANIPIRMTVLSLEGGGYLVYNPCHRVLVEQNFTFSYLPGPNIDLK